MIKTKTDLTQQRIGFYSYGSGCVAEYFSGVVQPGYREVLHSAYHAHLFATRTALSYEEYLNFYHFHYVQDGSQQIIPFYPTGDFRLRELHEHKRCYEKVTSAAIVSLPTHPRTLQGVL